MSIQQLEPFRCRRAQWCAERESVRDPVTGDHLGWAGATLYEADGLCDVCVDKVRDALLHLPGDVAELTTILPRPLNGGLREPVTGPGPGSSMPMREDIHVLRALIVHEACAWARAVARDADMGEEWDRFNEDHSRLGDRVQRACLLLRHRLQGFLDLGPTEYRARSLNVRRTDGHDLDTVTRYGDDYWCTRDGIDGAIVLLGLHQRAWRAAQRHTTTVPVTGHCPNCAHAALRRHLGKGHADCAHCHHRVSEKWLDVLRTAASNCVTDRDVAALTAALTVTRRPAA